MSTARIALAATLALLVFWAIGAYNRLVRLRSAVIAAWGPIDSQLRQRQALAIELAELLEDAGGGTLDPEAHGALQAVLAAARQAQAATEHVQVRPVHVGAVHSLGLAEQVLDGALRPVRALLDARPSLLEEPVRAERMEALLAGLRDADVQLAFVRRLFNEAVAAFNAAAREWPTRLIAGLFGFRPAAPWQAAGPERGPDSVFLPSSFGERP
jgi:LemA protein